MLKTRKQNKKKKGFTLIELIVVLAVLAIIALIAIPNFNQIRENSKIKSDERGADLIDKSVTLLVQDGTITEKTGGATSAIKDCIYGYNSNKQLDVTNGATTPFTADELAKIKSTIIDGKGPQSYNKEAKYKITATGLGTTTPDVKVELLDDTDSMVYDSNAANATTAP